MKDKTVAALLAFFVGVFGVHQFYLGKPQKGIWYLLFCWTAIPGLIALVDCFILLGMNQQLFDSRYNGSPISSSLLKPAAAAPQLAQATQTAELILKLNELRKEGLISEAEFEAAKRKALGISQGAA